MLNFYVNFYIMLILKKPMVPSWCCYSTIHIFVLPLALMICVVLVRWGVLNCHTWLGGNNTTIPTSHQPDEWQEKFVSPPWARHMHTLVVACSQILTLFWDILMDFNHSAEHYLHRKCIFSSSVCQLIFTIAILTT